MAAPFFQRRGGDGMSGYNELIKNCGTTLDNIQMSAGNGIKAARVNGDLQGLIILSVKGQDGLSVFIVF